MSNNPDPNFHRALERRLIEHVDRLLSDERLRIDTTKGRRPVTSFQQQVVKSDASVDLKRTMSELNLPDRELAGRMPQGESVEIVLQKRWLGLFRSTAGRLKVVCQSPVRSILAGHSPPPMTLGELQKLLPSLAGETKIPTTLVILSTSGFTTEAHDLAERRADRTVILIEPNSAGGWIVTGPAETKALTDLFDPEADQEKRDRIRAIISDNQADLSGAGLASDKLAGKTHLPVPFVESELKSYAKANPGLAAKRVDGRVLLFRERSAPVSSGGSTSMPIIDRMKSLFARKGENEKKIALLSERRAALSQQRDRAYEEMGTLENRESILKTEFTQTSAEITKRRITSQILSLRKDLERRQQLIGMVNQQLEVVGTHLHNLELLQQGQTAKLPDSEEIVADAGKAEEMLAELQANVEIASGASSSTSGNLSAEEEALYEELNGQAKAAAIEATPETTKAVEPPVAQPARSVTPATRKAEPEAG